MLEHKIDELFHLSGELACPAADAGGYISLTLIKCIKTEVHFACMTEDMFWVKNTTLTFFPSKQKLYVEMLKERS